MLFLFTQTPIKVGVFSKQARGGPPAPSRPSSPSFLCVNADGYLSPAEVRAVLDQLRLPVSPTTLSAFLRICPEMPSGIPMTPIKSLDNFIWKQYADLQAVFKELDVSGDGRINESDLRIASGRLNLSLSDADIKKLIKIADKNGNGTVVRFPAPL